MHWLYEGASWINSILVLVALIIGFTWRGRREKGPLCSFLMLVLFSYVLFRITSLLVHTGVINWSSASTTTLQTLGVLTVVASNVLLIIFVIVAVKGPLI